MKPFYACITKISVCFLSWLALLLLWDVSYVTINYKFSR